ncbi:hypothetical protein ROA7450_03090 [Roseovarius albus]|uniref:Uncharacterized protein n=1 Tax=Roseovarius albus TaxID=1247867 RepID=A0A1X6ZS84_9RHOB|nr:hypothetical protein [Roseovarius albus]SLN59670.1 hypothetical protein ROA7450_03090 [Roseovarius albus]
MLQTTLSVPLDVKPESAPRLEALVEQFRDKEDVNIGESENNFGRLIDGIPTLHFMSISIFRDPSYDPIFILEINCDGAPGPLWAALDSFVGEDLRDMVRCCKRPLDGNHILYQEVTQPGSKAAVAKYLEAMAEPPSVFHHGNRGLRRTRIEKEAELFRAVRSELDRAENNPYFGLDPEALRKALRLTLKGDFPWLNEDAEPRVSKKERTADKLRLAGYAAVVMAILSLPGIIAFTLFGTFYYLIGVAVLFAVLSFAIYKLHKPLQDDEVTTNFKLLQALTQQIPAVIFSYPIFLAIFWLIDRLLRLFGYSTETSWYVELAYVLFMGFIGLLVVLPGMIYWLRRLELHDSSQHAAQIEPKEVAEMAKREDWVSQNHMGSIVHIRPGVLRTLIVRFGHRGLGLLLRVTARDGYLGSMRTVHFAHWAFLNNHSRLLFFSNYDQSWGSYLDDFIEKAHVGLTLAWGCGVGFPPTRFLIYDGASRGRLFKNWALASRSVSRFWISAYPDLSVDQIERNYRLAKGLREDNLNAEDAIKWVRDL